MRAIGFKYSICGQQKSSGWLKAELKGRGKGASVVLAASMAHVAAHLTIWALA